MLKIKEAKKHLRDMYRNEVGFVGVGIGRRDNEDTLRVYVENANFPIARKLAHDGKFEGFQIEIEVTTPIEAY
jgi:hypothetical protein